MPLAVKESRKAVKSSNCSSGFKEQICKKEKNKLTMQFTQLWQFHQKCYLLQKFLWRIHADERRNVNVNKSGHQILTIEAVHNATMTRDDITKILTIQRYTHISLSQVVGGILITLILKARLNPLAKKPPKGPMTELKTDIDREWKRNGIIITVFLPVIQNKIFKKSDHSILNGGGKK